MYMHEEPEAIQAASSFCRLGVKPTGLQTQVYLADISSNQTCWHTHMRTHAHTHTRTHTHTHTHTRTRTHTHTHTHARTHARTHTHTAGSCALQNMDMNHALRIITTIIIITPIYLLHCRTSYTCTYSAHCT